jgi:hypothetical protein
MYGLKNQGFQSVSHNETAATSKIPPVSDATSCTTNDLAPRGLQNGTARGISSFHLDCWRCRNHEWLARMRPRGKRAGGLTGFILAILILYRNRSKWQAHDRNVLAISMPESKWIEIDRND